jgi:hypothetical protein
MNMRFLPHTHPSCLKQKGTVMKTRKSKIQSLVIDIAVILTLVMAAIVFAFHGLNTKIPSLF